MLVFLASSLVFAPTAAEPVEPANPVILVTGRRIDSAEQALKACLARHCGPKEDIDASLALAESQIIAGKYKDARATLVASLGRNKDEARRYPVPVSDLYRANGRVAAHLGYDGDYYNSTWGIYRTLKQGLPSEAVRHFSALMEVAEMMGDTRGHERARLYYESIARQAREARRPDIAAIAELRSAIRHLPPGSMRDGIIRRIADSKDKALRAASLEAKLALARAAFERGDKETAQRIQAEFAAMDLKRPILIYTPSYEEQERAPDNGSMFDAAAGGKRAGGAMHLNVLPYGQWSTTSRLPPDFDDMWVDVTFRISPDGEVEDAHISRSSGDTFWAQPLLSVIKGRRYTAGKAGDAASTRIERYTYTAAYQRLTGTRFQGRSPDARVEYFDLSPMGIAIPN